ncbi:hypothetical protein Tco_0026532 [Tanacetum coccineum]
MKPRPVRIRETTPVLRKGSPRARRQRERVVEFEDAPNRDEGRVERNSKGRRPSEYRANDNRSQWMNLPQLLAVHLGRSENDSTSYVTPFIRWIKDYPLLDKLKMPSHVGSYDRKGDPENYLHLFEGPIRMHKWAMPIACHMFTYTLKASA